MTADLTLFYIFSTLAILSAIMVIRAKNPVYSVLFLILVFCNAAGLLVLIDLDFFAMVFLVVYVGAIAVLFLFVVMMLNIKLAEINENILRYLPIGGLIGLIFLFEMILILENDLIPIVTFQNTSALSTLDIVGIHGQFLISTIPILISAIFWNISKFSTIYSQWALRYDELSLKIQDINTVADKYQLPSVEYIQWPTKIENITTIEALGQVVYTYYAYYFIVASLILLVAMIGAIVLTMHKGAYVRRQEVFEQNNREFSKTVVKIRSS